MRVIAGKWKSHSIDAPKGWDTRPTTDRVKESMFNLLPHVISGVVLDLFAGSGALGIEALSRGADGGVFVDRDRKALLTIRGNLHRLGTADEAKVWQCSWQQAISRLATESTPVSWVFLDPPYHENLWEPAIELLSEHVKVTGGIICETPKSTELKARIGAFQEVKHKVYGDIAVTVYKPIDADRESEFE